MSDSGVFLRERKKTKKMLEMATLGFFSLDSLGDWVWISTSLDVEPIVAAWSSQSWWRRSWYKLQTIPQSTKHGPRMWSLELFVAKCFLRPYVLVLVKLDKYAIWPLPWAFHNSNNEAVATLFPRGTTSEEISSPVEYPRQRPMLKNM